MKVKDISEVNVEVKLRETFTVTTIMTEKKNVENQAVSVSTIVLEVHYNMIVMIKPSLERDFQHECDILTRLCGP